MDLRDLGKRHGEVDTREKLHIFATHYNWDDGFEIPKWIINHPLCDRGTALMMYWCVAPGYFSKYADRKEIPTTGWHIQQYDLLQEIEEKYLMGFYKHNTILINPRHDRSNSINGYD